MTTPTERSPSAPTKHDQKDIDAIDAIYNRLDAAPQRPSSRRALRPSTRGEALLDDIAWLLSLPENREQTEAALTDTVSTISTRIL